MSTQELGFDIDLAEIEEYACLTISFGNFDEIQKKFKKTSQIETLKDKLKKIILDYFEEKELYVDFFNDKFIIRFFQNLSFQSSVRTALNSALALMQKFSKISYNLQKKKNVKLDCRMTILKHELITDSRGYNQDIEIKSLQEVDRSTYYSELEILTDQYVNTAISRKFKQDIIYSTQTDNKYMEFYRFPLATVLEIIEEPEETETNDLIKQELPQIEVFDDEKTKIKSIDFSLIDINSEFLELNEADLPQILQMILHNQAFVSLVYAADCPFMSSYIRNIIDISSPVSVHLTCQENLKNTPYMFLKMMLSVLLGIDFNDVSRQQEMYEQLHAFDETDCLYRLFRAEINPNISPDAAHNIFKNVFLQIMENVQNITFFVERIDLCDETSLEFLTEFLPQIIKSRISFVFTANEGYALHKRIPELLYSEKYKNITVHKSSFQDLLTKVQEDVYPLMDTEYIYKIRAASNGNVFQYKNTIQYLKDTHVLFKGQDGQYILNKTKTVIIPTSCEQLVKKRFEALSEVDAKTLCYLVFAGGFLAKSTLQRLGVENVEDVVQSLSDKQFAHVVNNLIYVESYNLISKYIINSIVSKNKDAIVNDMLAKGVKVEWFKTANILEIFNLLELALSHGDFNCYLENSKLFFEQLKATTYVSPEIKQLEKRVYSVLEVYITKYPSEKIYPIAKIMQEDAIKKQEINRIIDISGKILDSSMMDKNYRLAEKCVRYIMNQLVNIKLSSEREIFHVAYYSYQCINAKILFFRGRHKRCAELLCEMLSLVQKPEMRQKFVENGIDVILQAALVYGAISKVILCQPDLGLYLNQIASIYGELDWFGSVISLEMFIHSEEYLVDDNVEGIAGVINLFIKAFSIEEFNYKQLAQNIHKMKLAAKKKKDVFGELLADLLTGYCYQQLELSKSLFIYEDVKQYAESKGIRFIGVLANLFIASYYSKIDVNKSISVLNSEKSRITQRGSEEILLDTLCNIITYNIALSNPNFGIDINAVTYKMQYAFDSLKLSKMSVLLDMPKTEEISEE